jgi:hypothetical protein
MINFRGYNVHPKAFVTRIAYSLMKVAEKGVLSARFGIRRSEFGASA